MAIGTPNTKANIDSLLSGLTRSLRQTVIQIHTFNGDIQGMTDEDLTALGYTSDDITLIRAISSDLAQLYGVFVGGVSLTSPKDFTINISKVWGVGP
jgi:hypothetical protein